MSGLLTEEEFAEVDLRDFISLFVHERAHALIADRYGVAAHVEIWPNPERNLSEKLWCGRVGLHHWDFPHVGAERRTGIAGLIAEQMIDPDNATDDDDVFCDFENALDMGEMSPTDEALAEGFTAHDITLVIRWLRPHIAALRAEAEAEHAALKARA